MQLILASKSPRRQELLKLLGLPFEVQVSEVEETYSVNLLPHEVVMYLSHQKADAVFKNNPNSFVIGSDTIVVMNKDILEKPRDFDHAYEMLKSLSGKTHQVITGVTLLSTSITDTFYSKCDVTFYPMSDQEIIDYINTNEPFDKAGAYGIQGLASKFIKEIKGDYYTVMGFPVSMVYQKLKTYGLL